MIHSVDNGVGRVIGVDTGSGRELARYLGAHDGGSIAGLAGLDLGTAAPSELARFIDSRTYTATLVASAPTSGPADESVRSALARLDRLGLTTFVNVPAPVAGQVMTAVLGHTQRVVAVTAGSIPEWLLTTQNPLHPFIDSASILVSQWQGPDGSTSLADLGLSIPVLHIDPTTKRYARDTYGFQLAEAPTALITGLLDALQFLLADPHDQHARP
ncbi:hypothetical protein [Gordonia crocea]|nr:hypothetical protein [Gordonia crocea]